MSKVIDFTSRLAAKEGREQPVAEDVMSAYDQQTEDIVDGWITTLLEEMEDLELTNDSDEFSRDFIFATEALRSLVYRTRGAGHFIQNVADQMIEVTYNEEADVIEGVWHFDDGNSINYTSSIPDEE